MRSKVIIFCALLFCSKFVASNPFGEESGRQRVYPSNNWQANENNAGQYHDTDFARTQNSNSMTNSAQQYPNIQNNQGRQFNNNYGFNNHPSPLQPLPLRNNPENFASATNERRSDGFPSGGDNFPNRNQNQYGQQNWPPHNRFVNSGSIAIATASTAHERPLQPVQEPYHNSGQHMQLPQVNRQYYQADSLYPGTRDLHYHPVAEKPGVVKYVAHSGSNSGTRPGTVHYENYNEPHAHNDNIANPGNNVYRGNSSPYTGPANSQGFEDYNRPPGADNAGSYVIQPESNNYNEAHAQNTNIAKPGSNTYEENSSPYSGPANSQGSEDYNRPLDVNSDTLNNAGSYIIQPESNNAANSYNNGPILPLNTRYNHANNENVANPIISLGPNKYPSNSYVPGVPTYPVLDTGHTRHFNNPGINSGPNEQPFNPYRNRENPVIRPGPHNLAPVNTYNMEDSGLTDTVYNNGNNDEGYLKPTNEYEAPFIPNDTPADGDKTSGDTYDGPNYEPESSDSYPSQDNPHEMIYHFSNGENVKDYFLNKIKKNFVIIHANNTVEYVDQLNTEDSPNYVVVKKNDNKPPLSQPQTTDSGPGSVRHNTDILDALSNKTDHSIPNDNNYNQSPTENDYVSSTVPQSPTSQETTPAPVVQSTTAYNYKPHNYHRPYYNRYYPHNRYWNHKYPVAPLKQDPTTTTTTSTTPSPEDEMIQKYIDSLSRKYDEDQYDSPSQTDRPSKNDYPYGHRRSTTPSSATPPPEDNNYYPHNSNYNVHRVSSPKPYTHASTKDDDNDTQKVLDSLANKNDNKWPPNSRRYDSPTVPPKDNNYYPQSHTRFTTPGSFHPTTPSPGSKYDSPDKSNPDIPYDSKMHHFLESLPDKTDTPPKFLPSGDDNDYYPHSDTPSKLNTKMSPDIYRSTTPCPDGDNDYPDKLNPDLFDSQMHHFLESLSDKTDSSKENDEDYKPLIPKDKDDSTKDSSERSSVVPISPTEITPVDEIITISPIELATDNVKDGSTPSTLDEGTFDKDNLNPIKYQSVLDEVNKPYDSSTPLIDHNGDETDDISIQITEGNNTDETVITVTDIVKNDTKSACNDSLTITDVPAKSDDSTAAPINQNGVNTDDTSTGDNLLDSKPPASGLKITLNVPNDFEDTLYINVDVPDSNTGDEDKSSEETLYLKIKRQNSSDTDSATPNCDNDKDQNNPNESSPNKNMMLDLSNALVVMNRTTDKDYMNQLLSCDSKVNLYVFQMPCQEQVLVERTKHTTMFCNGTCLEETTETTWKTKDDPTPTVISTRKFYGGDKCH